MFPDPGETAGLHGRLENADDAIEGGGAGVGEHAGVFHRVLGHDAQVSLFDSEFGQTGGDADVPGELADGGDADFGGVQGGEAGDVLAQGDGNVGEAGRIGDQVELAGSSKSLLISMAWMAQASVIGLAGQ